MAPFVRQSWAEPPLIFVEKFQSDQSRAYRVTQGTARREASRLRAMAGANIVLVVPKLPSGSIRIDWTVPLLAPAPPLVGPPAPGRPAAMRGEQTASVVLLYPDAPTLMDLTRETTATYDDFASVQAGILDE